LNDADRATPAAVPALDERNPWLGLASFTEETREYFYGREEETAELARRVQRKLLTILFGQSGLGKTSILRAGLVPRLRGQGYCPVYVRIDYGPSAPEPAEQIKQAIIEAARGCGEWTRTGVAVAGEPLWEFLHHRDDVLRDAQGRPLIPLLIFDQFEEIFTLAQTDEFGRTRAQRFIDDLADLVENRPPRSLELQLEQDEAAAERFDFARGDYRVLIALREDYLAPLEGLKGVMPSITQNRLRLAPMNGAQAMAAVLKPGRRLVSEEVAAAIVRFVAGGAEIEHAEVEPSLLSLICRELNDTRIAQGRNEISLDLLAGSHTTILSNFYERALADQPAAVRRIVEDQLLTESGFRENVAEERIRGLFAAAGAAPGVLARLVDRRLLRIEERLDVRRVELTHDVLCGVVKASRDLRKEREAREGTEKLLAEQRERELAARHALLRARKIAAVCIVLALAAAGAALFGFVSTRRAQRAELAAQRSQSVALAARAQAEHLLGYLSDNFVRELESFGRLGVIADFAQRQIDYFRQLPPELRDAEATRNGALAMLYYARAKRLAGQIPEARRDTNEAVGLLEGLRRGGDRSDATAIALGEGVTVQATILDNEFDPKAAAYSQRAAAILKPLATGPHASLPAQRAYIEALVREGFEFTNNTDYGRSLATLAEAKQIAVANGAKTLVDADMAAQYAEATAWQVESLLALGRNADALAVGVDADALADRLLEQRPGYRLALHAIQVIDTNLGGSLTTELRPAEALKFQARSEASALTLVHLDPNNTITRNNLGVGHLGFGDAYWAMGRLRKATAYYDRALADINGAVQGGAQFVLLQRLFAITAAMRHAQIGDFAAAKAILVPDAEERAGLERAARNGGFGAALAFATPTAGDAEIALERGDYPTAARLAAAAVERMRATHPVGGTQQSIHDANLGFTSLLLGEAQCLHRDYPAAVRSLRAAYVSRESLGDHNIDDHRDIARISTWLALSLARSGRTVDAAKTIEPTVRLERSLALRNHGDEWQHVELAAVLYDQALVTQDRRGQLLHEAAALVRNVPPAIRDTVDVRIWREWIRAAESGPR
jgi:tetratricopeptide (TPR) repeat protein